MKLTDFTAWQWEVAIVASRFRLGLLRDTEIIAFTHKLMDKGYYDDIMLDIIEYDPLYPLQDISSNFEKVLISINVDSLTKDEARYFCTLYRFLPFFYRPFNFNFFYSQTILTNFYVHFDDLLADSEIFQHYIDITEFYSLVYQINYGIELFVDNIYSKSQLNNCLDTFFLACEAWLNRNQPKILAIMHQLFP